MNKKFSRFSLLLCTCLTAFATHAVANTSTRATTDEVHGAFQRMLDHQAIDENTPKQVLTEPDPLVERLVAVLWTKPNEANNRRGNP